MGELLHNVQAGSADSGTGPRPRVEYLREQIQKADHLNQWELILKYDKQFRKAAAVDREEILGTGGCASVHVGARRSSGDPTGDGCHRLRVAAQGREQGTGLNGSQDGSGRMWASGTCHRWNRKMGTVHVQLEHEKC